MQSLYDHAAAQQIKHRLAVITPETRAQWGKMDAPQMVAHCAAALEMALGDLVIPQVWIGRLIGPLFKAVYSNDKPWPQGNPTAKVLIIADSRNLSEERIRLVALIDRFQTGGPAVCTTNPHCFFGKLTPREWGIGMYKHIDHHLRQFNA